MAGAGARIIGVEGAPAGGPGAAASPAPGAAPPVSPAAPPAPSRHDPRLALVALHRFGLGARPGDLARLAADPRGALLAEIAAGPARPEGLPASDAALRAEAAEEEGRRALRERVAAKDVVGPRDPLMVPAADPRPAPPARDRLFRAEAAARFRAAQEAPVGFAERWAWFWSNHFCVSAAKGGQERAMAGAYEREAVRPHAFGRFADLLGACVKHPAMLRYLDNAASTGPGSRVGRGGRQGLNENLGREVLELHSLGVDGGYAQADVGALARLLTGWTVVPPDADAFHGGRATFAPNRHEPGPQVLLGRSYDDPGPGALDAALGDLARHPSTSRHLARKIARHFVSDEPPPALVARLEAAFRDSDGDLASVARALVAAPEAWGAPLKLRSPHEFLAAAGRALGAPAEVGQLLGLSRAMGEPLWEPPSPSGFPDALAARAAPEAVRARLDVAVALARTAAGDPREVLEAVLGPIASPETRAAIARAEGRAQGFALLLLCPEFLRR